MTYRKRVFDLQDLRNVAPKSPKISLKKGRFGQFHGYILCLGNVVGTQLEGLSFRASEGWKSPQGLQTFEDLVLPALPQKRVGEFFGRFLRGKPGETRERTHSTKESPY